VGPHSGFRVSFGFRLVGMWGPLLVIARGKLAFTSPGLCCGTPLRRWRSGLSRFSDLHGWSPSAMNVQVRACDRLLAPYKL
jgi:hypothetical protein